MVVGNNGLGLETSTDEEISQRGLDLSLSRLEIISDNENIFLLGEFDNTRNKSVLGRSVNVAASFEDGGDGVDGRGRDFVLRILDSIEDILSGIVNSWGKHGETLGVSSPEDNNLVETVLFLEFSDILTNMLEMLLLVGSWDDIVSSGLLVSSDEIRVVDGWLRDDILHEWVEFLDEVVLKNLSSSHCFRQVELANVPSGDDDIIWVNKGENVVHREVDFFRSGASNLDCGRLSDRSIVVSGLFSTLGIPSELVLVGQDTTGDSSTIVTTKTDEHDSELGNMGVGLELVFSGLGGNLDLTIG